MITHEQITAAMGIAISISLNVFYIRDTLRGKIKPHMFTWFIWGLLSVIGAAAQFSDGAGAGAVVTGFLGCMSLGVAGLAFFVGEKNITRSDKLSFVAALSAVPLWLLTSEALTATILVTLINLLGAVPTYRKIYVRPQQESLLLFSVSVILCFMQMLSIEQVTLTTALFPAYLLASNASIAVLIFIRRRAVSVYEEKAA